MKVFRRRYLRGWIVIGMVHLLPFYLTAQHRNVLVGGPIDYLTPEEPSIAINPTNTEEMIVGANIDNYYYSTDGGSSWTHGVLTHPQRVWGDPCILADESGRFYFFHLCNPPGPAFADQIVCQWVDSPDGTWTEGATMGFNGTKIQDKEWAVIDPANGNLYTTWTQFDQYQSTDPGHHSNIRFSRSTDRGATWSDPVIINRVPGDCMDDDDTVEGAVPAGLVFDRSTDFGETWLEEDVFVSDMPGGWAFHVPGITTDWCNGMPVTACDASAGPHRGTIYIN